MHLCLKKHHPFSRIHCYISVGEVKGFKAIGDMKNLIIFVSTNDLVLVFVTMDSHKQFGRHCRLCWQAQVPLTFYVIVLIRLTSFPFSSI